MEQMVLQYQYKCQISSTETWRGRGWKGVGFRLYTFSNYRNEWNWFRLYWRNMKQRVIDNRMELRKFIIAKQLKIRTISFQLSHCKYFKLSYGWYKKHNNFILTEQVSLNWWHQIHVENDIIFTLSLCINLSHIFIVVSVRLWL